MPANLPTNIGPSTQHNNLHVTGYVSELNGNSFQWNNAYLNLFGAEYSTLGESFNTIVSGKIASISCNSDGNIVAVTTEQSSTVNVTKIYKFDDVSYVWSQIGADITDELASDKSGYSIALNASGNRIAVGSPYHDDGGSSTNNRGKVRVFEYNGTTWNVLGGSPVVLKGELNDDLFGWSVDLNDVGDIIVVGSPNNDPGQSTSNSDNKGSVSVWTFNGTAWIRLGNDAQLDGEANGDQTGWSVAINAVGDRIVVGAPYNDTAGNDSGYVRVFEWNGTAWVKLGSNIPGFAAGDNFGTIVDINALGDIIAVSSPLSDVLGTNRGKVDIYKWNGSDWSKLGDSLSGELDNDQFGSSMSLNATGDRVIVGSKLNDSGANDSGHIRIYQWDGARWVKFRDIDGIATSEQAGTCVEINAVGDIIVSGAINSVKSFSNSPKYLSSKWNNNITGKVIYVDATRGTDYRINTSKYNEHAPFSTIKAAVDVSASEDVVCIRAGSYTISSTLNLNSKGSLYFEAGTTVNVANNILAFSYSQTGGSTAIAGHAKFILGNSGSAILNLSGGNNLTSFTLECNNIQSATSTANIFTAAAGVLNIDVRYSIDAPLANTFNLSATSQVMLECRNVVCKKFLIADCVAASSFECDCDYVRFNSTDAGIDISSIGTTVFNIKNYTNSGTTGIGFRCLWDTDNASYTEIHNFNNIKWSTAQSAAIFISSPAATPANKKFILRGTNIIKTSATNSIVSDVAIDILTTTTFASSEASGNVTFKIGDFTADPLVSDL
jgi:hypothetical protein